jgi:hypothetical protein
VKTQTMLLCETGKVLGSSQENFIACSLQASAQDDAWLDIASGTCGENRDLHCVIPVKSYIPALAGLNKYLQRRAPIQQRQGLE